MHILLLILIIVALFFYFKQQKSNAVEQRKDQPQGLFDHSDAQQNVDINLLNDHRLGYLSKGKLFASTKDNQLEEIQSQHIQTLIDRAEKNQQRHGWKQGTSWGTTPVGGVRQFDENTIDVEFSSAAMLSNNKILYFLRGQGFGGLFRYDIESKEELRLAHRQSMDYTDLNYDASRDKILCTSFQNSGVSNILLMDGEGDSAKELTGGDTVDISPCWLQDGSDQIVFQSMGLARSAEGYVIARGPASIQILDIEKGEISPVLENQTTDYIDPKVSKQGDLYYIRRPYEVPQYKTSSFLMDTMMFPFRLLRAVFHYLNFFSLMYSREPLTSASSPYVEADLKDMILKGKRINTEEALKKGNHINGVPSLVPSNWELIRRDKNGVESVLAKSVLSYAIGEGDQIIYTNGTGVFILKNENSKLVFKDTLVTEVMLS